MTIDPEVAAIVGALVVAALSSVPRLQRSVRARRRALRECLACGRRIVSGERTCDCEAPE